MPPHLGAPKSLPRLFRETPRKVHPERRFVSTLFGRLGVDLTLEGFRKRFKQFRGILGSAFLYTRVLGSEEFPEFGTPREIYVKFPRPAFLDCAQGF